MMRIVAGLVVVSGVVALVGLAHAEEYPAWGDTGWVYASRRECCKAAISIANTYSADACYRRGGVPRPLHGGVQRGTCQVETAQDDNGEMLFRCYGEAAIWCR